MLWKRTTVDNPSTIQRQLRTLLYSPPATHIHTESDAGENHNLDTVLRSRAEIPLSQSVSNFTVTLKCTVVYRSHV